MLIRQKNVSNEQMFVSTVMNLQQLPHKKRISSPAEKLSTSYTMEGLLLYLAWHWNELSSEKNMAFSKEFVGSADENEHGLWNNDKYVTHWWPFF